MLSRNKIELVKHSYKAVTAVRPELYEDFYTRLFVTAPRYPRPCFREPRVRKRSSLKR